MWTEAVETGHNGAASVHPRSRVFHNRGLYLEYRLVLLLICLLVEGLSLSLSLGVGDLRGGQAGSWRGMRRGR